MNLREEIKDIIFDTIGGKEHVGVKWTECQEASNIIISKIEKRIDEIINTTTRYEKDEWINFYKGFDEAMYKVKEMLK